MLDSNGSWRGREQIEAGISRLGKSASECATLITSVTESADTHSPIRAIKESLGACGIECRFDSLERVLLGYAIQESISKVDQLPVPGSVRELIRKQFHIFSLPPGSAGTPALNVEAEENDPFIAACKICTLRRFPAGPMDWVVSGMPRSWLLKMPPADVPRVLKFLLCEFGGIKPAFYVHIAHPPRNRSLIIPKEVRQAYYRMVQALMLQPKIRGIMCATWLHDPVAVRMYPHLGALNEPYSSWGGKLVTDIGPAPIESGFLKHNSERRELYERGELNFRSVLAMWPRKAAIEWARANRSLE